MDLLATGQHVAQERHSSWMATVEHASSMSELKEMERAAGQLCARIHRGILSPSLVSASCVQAARSHLTGELVKKCAALGMR